MAAQVNRFGDEKIKEQITRLCKQHLEIAAVFLFGSFGTCHETEFSDIDFGVLFFPDSVPDLRGEMHFADLFGIAIEREDVDLVILNKAPLPLRYRIIAEGDLIYEKDYLYTSDFLAFTYKFFLDYNIDYRYFMDEYNRSLKEAYGTNG